MNCSLRRIIYDSNDDDGDDNNDGDKINSYDYRCAFR